MNDTFDFEIDKRDLIFQIRIPTVTKDFLEKLTTKQKTELNEKILLVMSETIHMANFDPKIYLTSE